MWERTKRKKLFWLHKNKKPILLFFLLLSIGEKEKWNYLLNKEKRKLIIKKVVSNIAMEKTKTNQNNFPEKKFSIAATRKHVDIIGELVFIKEQALPQLYKQASVHFGNENWYVIHFDPYWDEEEKFYYCIITCQAKPS